MIGAPLAQELAEMQKNWSLRGSAPPAVWRVPLPQWAIGDPAFIGDWLEELWRFGALVWGAVHSAGDRVRAGAREGPATVLFSDDPRVADDPMELLEASSRLWARPTALNVFPGVSASVAGANGLDPSSAATRLHPAFCRGRVIWRARVIVTAASTPTGQIVDPLLPLVRVPQLRTRTVAIAPVFAWGEPLVRRWEDKVGFHG